jgi:hypothetical protein
MNPTMPNFEIIARNTEEISIADLGPWDQFPTVTNRAGEVVAELFRRGVLKSGMRLFYFDSNRQFDEIVIEDRRFVGFRSGDGAAAAVQGRDHG